MRLPLAIATLFFAITTALPAFAATPAPISASLGDAAATPIEAVQYRQQTTRQRRQANTYRKGYNAYAAAPRARRGYSNPWGHCVAIGPRSPGASAYPEWDLC